ncbi:MAG: L-aspartate oxidase [Dehalococcoidia bacterium]
MYDYIVLGSGIAGLFTALLAREHGSVLVVTKGSIEDSNTRYAQGGIAAAVGPEDSASLHLRDTLAAGAGLVDEQAASILTDDAAARIADLVRLGVPFDTLNGEIVLGHEGAHSARRIIHAGGDATGLHIEMTLASVARLEGITVLEHTLATEILIEGGRVRGVRVLETRDGSTTEHACRHLVLATGGAGQLYRYTTNPSVATGDGIALAYRAGAELMDMEFIQFHPTALRLPGVPVFLISEAVRGEGGGLYAPDGRRFMLEVDERAELAPRDVVARAIVREMTAAGSDHVWLDVTHLPAERITARFPQIYRFCLEHGLDIKRERIPVSPAAHYTMGGVRTNTWGQTTIPSLYACGEAACTGVHGANRLASNSLLETVVFARRVVERSLDDGAAGPAPADDARSLPPAEAGESSPPSLRALQTLLWEKVGIVRDRDGLDAAARTLSAWQAMLPPPRDREEHELANLILLGRLVVDAALRRTESRGAHFRADFPSADDAWLRHQIYRSDAPC